MFFFLFLITFVSCVSHRLTKFQPYKKGSIYKFIVPQGFLEEKRFSGCHEYSQEYYYPDSSVFYVTTFENTHNYEEIRKQNTYADRFSAFRSGDTITLEGIDGRGLYWKDRLLIGGLTIGYSKVPTDKKSDFDKSILSIRKVK